MAKNIGTLFKISFDSNFADGSDLDVLGIVKVVGARSDEGPSGVFKKYADGVGGILSVCATRDLDNFYSVLDGIAAWLQDGNMPTEHSYALVIGVFLKDDAFRQCVDFDFASISALFVAKLPLYIRIYSA